VRAVLGGFRDTGRKFSDLRLSGDDAIATITVEK
jgi:hypothetical protein